MVTERDFVQLPYNRDLTEAGLLYSRRMLLRRRGVASPRMYDAIRRAVASAALDLGFRRYLGERGIVFGVHRPPPFTDPDRYDVQLGDRTCELKGYLISRTSQWDALSDDPRMILEAPALVPLDRHTTETVRARDVYAFAFVGASVAPPVVNGQGFAPSTSLSWAHVMPPLWRRTRGQSPLGPLRVKAELTESIGLGLGGQDRSGAAEEIGIRLSTARRLQIPNSWIALNCIWASARPSGRLGIHSSARQLTHVIEPGEWQNVWLEGWGITLLGWITRQEFRSRAHLVPEGRRVFQFDRTKTRNLAVAISELKPMAELIGRVEGSRPAS